ncbi:NifB/NifX family molybdenum-iron cluster-binding protein [Methanobacterium formicicum]|uniref:NifB/NifX family molybdenum-iron cluster-binding protein n=1 Tax=Methanobacterium formicicum TaxID=2162 RepID=UPI002351E778|nr:NifB/NifX family molybdenum-iron cluster-binding protein [Methanobacterium formicicum]
MPIRVAAASSDGKYVNQHFGKADKFLIFDIKDNGEHEFIELRETAPPVWWRSEFKRGNNRINFRLRYSAGESDWTWSPEKTDK